MSGRAGKILERGLGRGKNFAREPASPSEARANKCKPAEGGRQISQNSSRDFVQKKFGVYSTKSK